MALRPLATLVFVVLTFAMLRSCDAWSCPITANSTADLNDFCTGLNKTAYASPCSRYCQEFINCTSSLPTVGLCPWPLAFSEPLQKCDDITEVRGMLVMAFLRTNHPSCRNMATGMHQSAARAATCACVYNTRARQGMAGACTSAADGAQASTQRGSGRHACQRFLSRHLCPSARAWQQHGYLPSFRRPLHAWLDAIISQCTTVPARLPCRGNIGPGSQCAMPAARHAMARACACAQVAAAPQPGH